MSDLSSTLFLLGMAGAAAFFFSGMEAGVVALNRLRIRQRARAGDPSAQLLNGFLEQPEDFLWTILIGNTLANFVVVVLTFLLLHNLLGTWRWALLVALALAVFAWYALTDLLPKMLFQQFPNRLCLLLARPFRLAHLILAPAVAAASWSARRLLRWTGGHQFTGTLWGNRDELRQVMQESAHTLSAQERQMVNRVLDLQTVTVGALAEPFAQVTVASRETPIGEVLSWCRERDLTHVPVRDPASGRVLGVASLRALLYRADVDLAKPISAFVVSALYFDDSMRLERALERLRKTGERLAIVRDRTGVEVGVITLEDILRFIFGEVRL